MICTALCQGAAQHFVDRANGVKDFDVWTFYAEIPGEPYPPRWRTTADFGTSSFGRRHTEPDGTYIGRRVDLIGRSLPASPAAEPISVLAAYLAEGRTESARLLAAKAVVVLEPRELLGTVAWKP